MTPETHSLVTIDEGARRRFEAAWLGGRPEPIEEFLTDTDASRRRATLEELILIDMECAWKRRATAANGGPEPAPVESYLARFPELNEPTALSRLLREEW